MKGTDRGDPPHVLPPSLTKKSHKTPTTHPHFNCDDAADENDHNISVCMDILCGNYQKTTWSLSPAT